jgi:hypothetical protein
MAVEEDKRLVRTVLEFNSFYVAGPSLSVRSTWFPTHLPPERTGLYPYLGRNRQPAVPEIHDPDKYNT